MSLSAEEFEWHQKQHEILKQSADKEVQATVETISTVSQYRKGWLYKKPENDKSEKIEFNFFRRFRESGSLRVVFVFPCPHFHQLKALNRRPTQGSPVFHEQTRPRFLAIAVHSIYAIHFTTFTFILRTIRILIFL